MSIGKKKQFICWLMLLFCIFIALWFFPLRFKEKRIAESNQHYYQSKKMIASGDFENAVRELKIAVKKNPNNSYAFEDLLVYGHLAGKGLGGSKKDELQLIQPITSVGKKEFEIFLDLLYMGEYEKAKEQMHKIKDQEYYNKAASNIKSWDEVILKAPVLVLSKEQRIKYRDLVLNRKEKLYVIQLLLDSLARRDLDGAREYLNNYVEDETLRRDFGGVLIYLEREAQNEKAREAEGALIPGRESRAK